MSKLSQLLITSEEAAFQKAAANLAETVEEQRLGSWWVKLNKFEWPSGGDDPIPLVLHEGWDGAKRKWAHQFVFDLISNRLSPKLQTLYWRAAGNSNPRMKRAARAELAHLRRLRQVELDELSEAHQ